MDILEQIPATGDDGSTGNGTSKPGRGKPPKGGTGEYAEPNGPTLDQVVAKSFGSATGRASFHAAVQIQLKLVPDTVERGDFRIAAHDAIDIEPRRLRADRDFGERLAASGANGSGANGQDIRLPNPF